ncbi:MAG TPA: hypothetical protein VFY45_14675 [Baekduia sp.]|nr:hypothetical protein [Baekduia sp.]
MSRAPGTRRSRGRSAGSWLTAATCVSASAVGVLALGAGTSAADTCANAALRTGLAAHLPDCRAFEQVSPINKNGAVVKSVFATRPAPGWSSADGSTIMYNADAAILPNQVRGFPIPTVARRTPNGWDGVPVVDGPRGVINPGPSAMTFQIPSLDRTRLLFVSGSPFTSDNPESPEPMSGGVNLTRGTAADWISKPTWPGASPQPGHIGQTTFAAVGASDDLSSTFFTSQGTLTPEDGLSGRGTGDATAALYRFTDGRLWPAGVLPDGTTDADGSDLAGLALGTGETNSAINQEFGDLYGISHPVAPDGSSWLFVSPRPDSGSVRAPQLYLGRPDASSILLSQPSGSTTGPVAGSAGVVRVAERGASAGPATPGVYAVRSRDGRFVLFSTIDQLTGDAPAGAATRKTYRYDVATRSLTYLPALTVTNVQDPPHERGVVRNISDDGSRVLYYNRDANALMLWRDNGPAITLGTPAEFGDVTREVPLGSSRFSTDGRTLTFMSKTAIGSTANHPGSTTQIYRHTEPDGQLVCISCTPAGADPAGDSSFSLRGSSYNYPGSDTLSVAPVEDNRGVSDDGRRVVFTTTTAFSSDDHNTVADVYEWSVDQPQPQLLSSGAASSLGDVLVDTSASGDDVFFVSVVGLSAGDRDGISDLYDARVGGGFAPTLVDPGCVGDACRPPLSAPPSLLGAASAGTAPEAEAPDPLPEAKTPKAASLSVRRTGSSATQVTLAVSTSGAGVLRASGHGVTSVSVTAKRAGTSTVKVKLSSASRRALKEKGRLTVRVTVRFTPAQGKAVSKTVSLTIKRATSASRKAR